MGGPTYSGRGVHRAVRVRGAEWPACLFCGRVRSTDHQGTVLLEPNDPRILCENYSMDDQSKTVRELASETEEGPQ